MLACLACHISSALQEPGAERQLQLLGEVCSELSFIGLWEAYHPAAMACETPWLLKAETAMLSAAGSLASMLRSSAAYLDSLGGGGEQHEAAASGGDSSGGSGGGGGGGTGASSSGGSGGGCIEGAAAAVAAQQIFTGSYHALCAVTCAMDEAFTVHTFHSTVLDPDHAYKHAPVEDRGGLALALAQACTQLACAAAQPRLWQPVQLSPTTVAAARTRWGALLVSQHKDCVANGFDKRFHSESQDRVFAEWASTASLPAHHLLTWVCQAGCGFLNAAGRHGLLQGLDAPTAAAVLRSLLGLVEVLVSMCASSSGLACVDCNVLYGAFCSSYWRCALCDARFQ